MKREEAVRSVMAAYTMAWAKLNPGERGEFDNDLRLFMRFFVETSSAYRNHLLNDLNPPARECQKCGGNPCDCHYDVPQPPIQSESRESTALKCGCEICKAGGQCVAAMAHEQR